MLTLKIMDENDITFKVGIYIRLSREDDDKDNESESITNQRNFILDYLKENHYILYDEYVDDGYSGTTFDRPGFNRMIKDIETKKINMVITKDMSRLGRDYVNFGYYIEKYFPEHNIRYIAITDNVDTFVDSVGNDMVPFKAIFNDMYAKDISKKIKASISIKKKQGQFLGPHAPYGYHKDPNDKHQLIVDPVASVVVKRIYQMFLDGNSVGKIAHTFTKELIPRPSVHKNMEYKYSNKTKDIWDETTILDILKNPNYTGNLYQGRRKKINYKSKKIMNVSKDNWIVAYNTHEPIIDMKTYEMVEAIHDKNKLLHKSSKRNVLLKGFLFCKECGHTLGINTSSDKTRNYTVCNHYRKYSKLNFCTSHSMRYETIEEIVLKDVKKMCKELIDTKRLETIMKNNSEKTKVLDVITSRISQAKKNIENNTSYIQNSYIDRLKGLITIEMYHNILDKLSEEISINQKLIVELEAEKQSLTSSKALNDKDCKKIINEYLSLKKPNRNLLANIIDKITVDENKNIDIYYKIKPSIR